ncbi:cytosolic leucyl tRNA synthetase [Tulasnella sp. JGI-2019a]|nr:cytosolic leucyl tRNA synthetase [Tulasnella sp. JGI-2019a]
MATSQDGPIELVKTDKRDFLIGLEKKYQERWRDEHLFEVDAPPAAEHDKHPKWFGTFPFPYMNGSLHLGHGFTISKIEFNAGFQRMLGKRALFPVGMHCTGMPIKAASDKLIREIEMFGPDFERYSEDAEPSEVSTTAPVQPNPPTAVDKAKKGKVAAKATGLTYQFQIMESIGVPRAEIKKFADPYYWLHYFPPITMTDCSDLGVRADWRRSFITTDVNPYFDSFVRWQINKLHKLGKIKFGERYTIYSPKDGQPCMDHDRQSGEALNPQEYTALKMEVVSWSPEAEAALKDKVAGKKVYFVAATLRPETMYGQTNCFVGTAIKYGLFAVNDTDIYICTYRAARNMAFQGHTQPREKINQLAEIDGSKLVGTKIKAPNGIHPEVYVLPMDNVLATKGTGVVTSVPSDSPDDYATLMDLKKKPEFYKIKPEWVALDPTPVLSTPTYGDLTAKALVTQMKIQSQKDVKQLAEAKEIAYKEGFYQGTMLVGQFKGLLVQEAKPKVRAEMIDAGLAFAYAEPEGLIISRSNDECVVALMDQYYLDYGEPVWKAQAEKLLARMETYGPETRNGFEAVLNWLNQWACARSYGLGSKVPWDPQFLVESLSDSTIYMSYYTVSHLLQGGATDGSKLGPIGIKPEQLTDEVWDYVIGGAPSYPETDIPTEKLDTLKNEFTYFYPLDIRSSGKDLIPNHLTFAIYNHAALFPENFWPRSMRANGHLMLNGKKMSKSTGNSLTLRQSIDKFGADATRLTLADAGDGIEDANFEEKTANAAILRLHTLIDWCEETVDGTSRSNLRAEDSPKDSYHDRVFEQEINQLINQTKTAYTDTMYKEALRTGFYEMQSCRDWYREVTSDIGMHIGLVKYWIKVSALLVSPIAPHFAEHLWTVILKEPKSIQLALWPELPVPVDQTVIDSAQYMRTTLKEIRDAELTMIKKGNKAGKMKGVSFDPAKKKAVRIFVASKFPEWQEGCIEIMKGATDMKTGAVNDVKVKQEITQRGLIKDKKIMPFVMNVKRKIVELGPKMALERTLPFNEKETLEIILPYLKRNLGFAEGDIMLVEDAQGKEGPGFLPSIITTAEPGSPGFIFWNVE